MLLSFLTYTHATSFTIYRDMGAVPKKNISDGLTDHSDVIFDVPKCSKSKFSGAAPQTPLWGSLVRVSESLGLLPRPPSWWQGDSMPYLQ